MSSVTRLFLSVFLIVSTSLTYAGIKMTTYNIRTFDLKNSSTNKVELKK